MKKLYTSILSLLVITALTAQVNVTYQVDVTDYIVDFTVDPTGMKVGGNFADHGGMNGADAMVNWSPSDATSTLTDMGDNIWSITVTYPSSSIGNEQLYKFVNGDWGTPGEANEGGDMSNIATDGCGVDDGSGNINRTLLIPDSDLTLQFCWEACFQCDGSNPTITSVQELNVVSDVSVSPNPTDANARITYNLDQTSNVAIRLLNVLGSQVIELTNGTQSVGNYVFDLDMTELESGIYLYQIQAGTQMYTGKLVKR